MREMIGEFVDIHSHILPGIDDGAQDIEMSMRMLQIACDNGIKHIVLTPHYKPMHHNADKEKIRMLTDKLRGKVEEEGLEIKLYDGNEVYYHSEALMGLENDKVFRMADSSYVLVEFGPMDEFDYIRNGLYQLLSGGYRPIVAHAERYEKLFSKQEGIEDIIEMGCYIQVNAGSIMGGMGYRTKSYTKYLLKNKLVHFVATDAHNTDKRGPFLKDCAKYISRKYGKDYMRRLLCENPAKVLGNEYI